MSRADFIGRLRQFAEFSFLTALFVLPFAKAGFEIFFGVALILWFLEKIAGNKPLSKTPFFLWIAFLFIVSSSVSAFHSGYPDLSFKGILKLIKFVLVMFVAVDLFSDYGRLRRLLLVSLAGLSLVVFDSLAQNIRGTDLILGNPVHYPNEQIRLTGPYSSYGLLAAELIAFIPVLLALVLETKRLFYLKRIGLGILLLLSFYVLYQTQSRGGWLAAFGSLFVYSLLTRNKWFFVILAVALIGAPFVLPRKILFHLDLYNKDASLTERKLLWNRALSVIKAEPLFGCGINTFTKNYHLYTRGEKWALMEKEAMKGKYSGFGEAHSWQIPGHPNQIPDYYVHNGYLQIAAETGLISLGFFLTIIGFSFYSGVHALRRIDPDKKPILIGLVCGLIALLLHTSIDTILQGLQSAPLIWLFLGLLIAINQVETE